MFVCFLNAISIEEICPLGKVYLKKKTVMRKS